MQPLMRYILSHKFLFIDCRGKQINQSGVIIILIWVQQTFHEAIQYRPSKPNTKSHLNGHCFFFNAASYMSEPRKHLGADSQAPNWGLGVLKITPPPGIPPGAIRVGQIRLFSPELGADQS